MSKGRYDAIDAKILAFIGVHPDTTFVAIDYYVRTDAKAICEEDRAAKRSRREPWRVTDARLQALRKRGKIVHCRKNGWRLVK